MTHDEARLLLSAIADGEAERTPDLDAHLATCDGCRAFRDSVTRLSGVASDLPRETARWDLPLRVRERITRRRVRVRLAVAVAFVTALAVAFTLQPGPGPGSFRVPPAEAAEQLPFLRSLYVERTGGERIWWRAPGYVRVESGTRLTIDTPETHYADGVLITHVRPRIALPEPISPTVALLGTDEGPGPTIAGMRTRAYSLQIGDTVRRAYAAGGFDLGGETRVVLSKIPSTGIGRVVRVTKVEYNPDLPDSLFEPPFAKVVDGGFREGRAPELAPKKVPEAFALVRSGRDGDGATALYAYRSMLLLVTTVPQEIGERRTLQRGFRTYTVWLDLYAPPRLEFPWHGGTITLQAPLPVDSLVDVAERMYPPE